MPLTRWEKLSIKLKIKYHIPRWIFTIVIPVIIAAIFVFWSFSSGFASIANPLTYGQTSSTAALKQIEFEAIAGNLSVISLNKTTSVVPSVAPVKQNLYITVVAAPAIAVTPLVIDTERESRRKAHYEQDFADFLFELSELVRGGIDPAKAFLTLAQGEMGSITKFIKIASRQMAIGFTFEQALHNLGDSLQSDLSKRYIDLVIQASYSGGSVSNLIQQAAIDMGSFLAIDKEKRSGLAQYTVVLYMGQIVLIVLAAIIVVQFIPQLVEITQIGSAGLSGFLGTSDIASVPLERDLFFLVFINGFFGGIVIGKLSEGKVKAGLKHSVILAVIALLAWQLYVLPSSEGTAQTVHITVISYDSSGPAGLPLPHPLEVNITSTKGAPVNQAPVSFVVTGGGSASPQSTSSDIDGEASTQITLGNAPGTQFVIVSSGNSQTVVAINVTSTGGGD